MTKNDLTKIAFLTKHLSSVKNQKNTSYASYWLLFVNFVCRIKTKRIQFYTNLKYQCFIIGKTHDKNLLTLY